MGIFMYILNAINRSTILLQSHSLALVRTLSIPVAVRISWAVEAGPQPFAMRLHFICIAFTCAVRANPSSDRSINLGDTPSVGINVNDENSITGLDNGGVPHPPTYGGARPVDQSSPKILAAGNTGNRCRSGNTTPSLERRLQEKCSVETETETQDPMTSIKDFILKQTRPKAPKSGWVDWPLPLENGPCDPSEAFVCCDTYFQEFDRTWTVSYCSES